MSIRLYSGIMGSGKTYRVVYELKYGDLLEKYYVFHNIENLHIENKFLKEYGHNSEFNPPELFTLAYQEQLSKQIRDEYGRNILWIIEECDKIGFDKNTKNIKEWLSMHRHLGQDIYLITQSKWNIAKEYANLLELEIQGKRGYVFDQFIYSWFSGGEKVATDRLPKKKDVYELYRSFHIPELKKKRSNLFKWMLGFGVIAVASIIYFFFFGMPNAFNTVGKDAKKVQSHLQSSSQPNSEQLPDAAMPIKPISIKDRPFFYAGFVREQQYMTDKSGNIVRMNYIVANPKPGVINETERKITLLAKDLPTYESTYIMPRGREGGGRDTRTDQAQESAQTSEIIREIWINVK